MSDLLGLISHFECIYQSEFILHSGVAGNSEFSLCSEYMWFNTNAYGFLWWSSLPRPEPLRGFTSITLTIRLTTSGPSSVQGHLADIDPAISSDHVIVTLCSVNAVISSIGSKKCCPVFSDFVPPFPISVSQSLIAGSGAGVLAQCFGPMPEYPCYMIMLGSSVIFAINFSFSCNAIPHRNHHCEKYWQLTVMDNWTEDATSSTDRMKDCVHTQKARCWLTVSCPIQYWKNCTLQGGKNQNRIDGNQIISAKQWKDREPEGLW